MLNRQTVAALIGLVIVAVGASWMVDTPVAELEAKASVVGDSARACGEAGEAVLAFPSAPVALYNNGIIRFLPCDRGILHILMSGSELGHRGAHVIVSQEGLNLWEGLVYDPVTVETTVEAGYWVTVAFVNDASRLGEDRNLWIREIEFVTR